MIKWLALPESFAGIASARALDNLIAPQGGDIYHQQGVFL
jgi:hypothetical protein